jgi:hypothetical protein
MKGITRSICGMMPRLTPSPNRDPGLVRESSCPRIVDPELASLKGGAGQLPNSGS